MAGSTLSVSAIAELEVQMHRLLQMMEEANARMCSTLKTLASATRLSTPSPSPTSPDSDCCAGSCNTTIHPRTDCSAYTYQHHFDDFSDSTVVFHPARVFDHRAPCNTGDANSHSYTSRPKHRRGHQQHLVHRVLDASLQKQ
jgi:hypothetical protein